MSEPPDDPLGPLSRIDVGDTPPIREIEQRHRRITRRRRTLRIGIPALVVAAAGAAVGLVQLGDDDADTITEPAITTPTAPGTDEAGSADPSASEVDARFEVSPDVVRPGDNVEISGTACPADASWEHEVGHWVVIGAGVANGPASPTINEPSEAPGHVSFNLVPEYLDAQIAQATPADDGTWTTSWTVPEAGSDSRRIWLTALCIGGTGLESGSVHYGARSLTIDSTETSPESRPRCCSRPLPTVRSRTTRSTQRGARAPWSR